MDMESAGSGEHLPEIKISDGLHELLDTYSKYIEARSALLNLCEESIGHDDPQLAPLRQAGEKYTAAFIDYATGIFLGASEAKVGVEALCTEIMYDDDIRNRTFRRLSGCDNFSSLKDEEEENTEILSSGLMVALHKNRSNEDFIKEVGSDIVDQFGMEFGHFLAHLTLASWEDEEDYSRTARAKLYDQMSGTTTAPSNESRRSLISRELIDVAKIAGGIVIAGLILRRKSR